MSAKTHSPSYRRPGLPACAETCLAMSDVQPSVPQEDTAVVIGLALAHVRQGRDGVRSIPSTLVNRLVASATDGDPACRLVLDWLGARHDARKERSSLSDVPTESSGASLTEIIFARMLETR
jgi:hypothetical protein